MQIDLRHGDCVEVMKTLADASVDAVVTDPPYELGFMGKGWDASGIAYSVEMWREVLRVLKPGGHLLAFGGTRTYHRMACAIEDAGFEIRDSIHWIYGSGFPKSLDVLKAIDKTAGAKRQVVGLNSNHRAVSGVGYEGVYAGGNTGAAVVTAPATDAAKQWSGWGTALKPAHEPVVVARKPLDRTVAANVQAHGTGALNINGCRLPYASAADMDAARVPQPNLATARKERTGFDAVERNGDVFDPSKGRWPPNILLSHTPECGETCDETCAVAEMDRQQDGASRFFPVFRYQAKASRSERGVDNKHPTVKPVALIEWLLTLVVPPGGTVLDSFTGSGTTGIAAARKGIRFIGIEREAEYFEICKARIAAAQAEFPAQKELFSA